MGEELLPAMLTSLASLVALLMATLLLMTATVGEFLDGLTLGSLSLRPSLAKLSHSEFMFTQMPLMPPQPHLMELLSTINNLLAKSSIYFIVLYAMHRFEMYCVQHVLYKLRYSFYLY